MKKLIAIGLIAGSMAVVTGCGGSSSSSDTGHIASDLTYLLTDKSLPFEKVQFCTHQSDNQYVCKVTGTSDGTVYANVTDDGSSIYEEGVGH